MDEFKLQQMYEDIENLKNSKDSKHIVKMLAELETHIKFLRTMRKEVESYMKKKKESGARDHAEHGHPTPHEHELNQMSIARLKQRLASHDQNERETFSKNDAKDWKDQRAEILSALQKAIKENRTKNVGE